MGRSAPRELSEAPGATRPRPPWGRVAGAVVAVLAVLLTALVAPVNGGWWWVQRISRCLSLDRPGARSEHKAHLLTEAGEKLDVSVSGAVRSGVDSQLRYLCASHAPFTMRWYPSKGPVLEVREG